MAKTIMVVDDSASLLQVVSIAFTGAGYDIVRAGDGKDALAKLDALEQEGEVEVDLPPSARRAMIAAKRAKRRRASGSLRSLSRP